MIHHARASASPETSVEDNGTHYCGTIGRDGTPMPELQYCASPRCAAFAVRRCFDCDRPFCAAHLTRLQLSLAGAIRRFWVCRTCLVTYLNDPDVRRIVTVCVA